MTKKLTINHRIASEIGTDLWLELTEVWHELLKAKAYEKAKRFEKLVERSSHVKLYIDAWKSREEQLILLLASEREKVKDLKLQLSISKHDLTDACGEIDRLTGNEESWSKVKDKLSKENERKTGEGRKKATISLRGKGSGGSNSG